MKLEARKERILDFIIRDYIKAAVPVSSGKISNDSGVETSSATIRNIMGELADDGFIIQPHTSAGRIPSEKGYRYFIKHLMEERTPPPAMQKEVDVLVDRFAQNMNTLFDELSHTLARELRLFSGAGVLGRGERFFGHGLAEVFQEPEFGEHRETVKFGKFIDNIDAELDQIYRDRAHQANVCDVTIRSFGLVTAYFQNEAAGECVVFAIGPQRMNYEKASAFLKYAVDDLIETYQNT